MVRTDSRAGDTLLGCPTCSSTCSSSAPELPLCRTSEAAGVALGHVPTTPLLPAALGTGSRAWLCPPGSQHQHSQGSCAQEESKGQTTACSPEQQMHTWNTIQAMGIWDVYRVYALCSFVGVGKDISILIKAERHQNKNYFSVWLWETGIASVFFLIKKKGYF